MKQKIRTLLWLLLVISLPVVADTTPLGSILGDEDDSNGYDSSGDKPWQEGVVKQIPPLPADGQLLQVPIDALPQGLKLFLDKRSLHLSDKDQTLRFWVVIRSPAGAYNATYEGLRCDTGEFKIYAYGRQHANPQVRLAPKPVWHPIGVLPGDHFRRELAKDYLCDGPTPRTPRDIIEMTVRPDMANPFNDLSDD